jgi:hypothetical protein
MRLNSEIVLVALTTIIAGVAYTGMPAEPAEQRAQVRFTNSTSHDATLQGNGVALFTDVKPTITTDWTVVTDSVVNFTLVVPGEGNPPTAAKQTMADGGRYTVTANVNPEGNTELTVTAEVPVPDSTKH